MKGEPALGLGQIDLDVIKERFCQSELEIIEAVETIYSPDTISNCPLTFKGKKNNNNNKISKSLFWTYLSACKHDFIR